MGKYDHKDVGILKKRLKLWEAEALTNKCGLADRAELSVKRIKRRIAAIEKEMNHATR